MRNTEVIFALRKVQYAMIMRKELEKPANGSTDWGAMQRASLAPSPSKAIWARCVKKGLLDREGPGMKLTPEGLAFLRGCP